MVDILFPTIWFNTGLACYIDPQNLLILYLLAFILDSYRKGTEQLSDSHFSPLSKLSVIKRQRLPQTCSKNKCKETKTT